MRKLFEFQCNTCKHYQESLVRGEEEYPECPEGHGVMHKLVSSSSFHFTNGQGTSMGGLWAIRGQKVGSA